MEIILNVILFILSGFAFYQYLLFRASGMVNALALNGSFILVIGLSVYLGWYSLIVIIAGMVFSNVFGRPT